tara:strand:+ start:156 stop:386 length:231 start_codon:yes stop_codon:yes gene_type:complete
MKTNQILILAGVGIVAYMWWKKSQTTSSFANIGGSGSLRGGGGDGCAQRVCRKCGVTTNMVSDGMGDCKCPEGIDC